jgi:hypothetical protein
MCHSQKSTSLPSSEDTFSEGDWFFGFADEREMPPLPPWSIPLFSGFDPSQKVVAYDTRNNMDNVKVASD